jgi:hypothetical protein
MGLLLPAVEISPCSSNPNLPKPTIDQYRLGEMIGEGAHGTVYRAPPQLKNLALKLLRSAARPG